jgi:hypothetical protein
MGNNDYFFQPNFITLPLLLCEIKSMMAGREEKID